MGCFITDAVDLGGGTVHAHTKESVAAFGRYHRLDRGFNAAFGRVLETYWRRCARSVLPGFLVSCIASADRIVSYQGIDVLRGQSVESFHSDRHAEVRNLAGQQPGSDYAEINVVRLIKQRVIDKTLPAQLGARRLHVSPHDNFKIITVLLSPPADMAGIFQRAFGVVNRAGADYDQQFWGPVIKNVDDGLAALPGSMGRIIGDRQDGSQHLGGNDRRDSGYPGVDQSLWGRRSCFFQVVTEFTLAIF